jgi:hypothetical protein
MNVVVRTRIDPGALAQRARAQALAVDPDQPVHSVTTMERLLDDTMQQDRFAMLFVALFAAAGLVTAATGVYALLLYGDSAETRNRGTHGYRGVIGFSGMVNRDGVSDACIAGLCRRRSGRGSHQSASAIRSVRYRTSGYAHAGERPRRFSSPRCWRQAGFRRDARRESTRCR